MISSFFEHEARLPCKKLTREEINVLYAGKTTRPIPAGYTPRATIRTRLNAQQFRPYGVFAVNGEGKRSHISSHHSIDAAEKQAMQLNDENTDISYTYVSGERLKKKWKKKETETDNDSTD